MKSRENPHYKNLLLNPLVILFSAVVLYYVVTVAALWLVSTFGISLENVSNGDMFWFSLVRLIVFFGLLASGLLIFKRDWAALGFARPKKAWFYKLLPAYAVYLAVAFIALGLVDLLVPGFDIGQVQEVGFSQQSSVWQKALIGLSLVVMTPLLEETLFRGIFFRGLRKKLPFWVSAFVVSTVFAAAHGQWNVALDTFVLSLAGCWLTERSGSIYPAILLHIIKNAIAFTLILLK